MNFYLVIYCPLFEAAGLMRFWLGLRLRARTKARSGLGLDILPWCGSFALVLFHNVIIYPEYEIV